MYVYSCMCLIITRTFPQAHVGLFCNFQNGVQYVSIFAQRGEEWKKTRQLISPAFSAHKLKLVKN